MRPKYKQRYICDASLFIDERKIVTDLKYVSNLLYVGNAAIQGEVIFSVHAINRYAGKNYFIRAMLSKDALISEYVRLPFVVFGDTYKPGETQFGGNLPITNQIGNVIFPFVFIYLTLPTVTEPDIAMIEYSAYLSL